LTAKVGGNAVQPKPNTQKVFSCVVPWYLQLLYIEGIKKRPSLKRGVV